MPPQSEAGATRSRWQAEPVRSVGFAAARAVGARAQPMNTTELFLIAMLLIFSVPYLI
ncbi:MAG: hypothetical protein IH627_16025 [Rubrivivax sp.]|nr:hypothetical protein [Rubrivivax sp.]